MDAVHPMSGGRGGGRCGERRKHNLKYRDVVDGDRGERSVRVRARRGAALARSVRLSVAVSALRELASPYRFGSEI